MFPYMMRPEARERTVSIEQFFADVAKNALPAVSFLEPAWNLRAAWGQAAGAIGNDYHPVCDVMEGEILVRNVYEALASAGRLGEVLLLIIFDENGGIYDHVAPPRISPSGFEKSGRTGPLRKTLLNQAGALVGSSGYDVHDADRFDANGGQYGSDFGLCGPRISLDM